MPGATVGEVTVLVDDVDVTGAGAGTEATGAALWLVVGAGASA